MINFSGYEDYCKAFSDEKSRLAAELVYYSRCRLADICALADEGENYFGTDGFTFGEFSTCGGDMLSDIISEVRDAVLYISRNLREKILREDTLIPIYQVKEISSAGMNWISRRNGRTIREKLSDCNSIMGVNRRMSVDTGENRLFVVFLKRLVELIELKTTLLPPEFLMEDEEELMEQLLVFLKSEQAADIGRWENLPPNNTLLSDRHYRCIWHGWTRLQELDEMIAADIQQLDANLSTVLFWSMFRIASGSYSFPQTPVSVDYDSFCVKVSGGQLRGISSSGCELFMKHSGNKCHILINGIVNTVTLTDAHLVLDCGGVELFSADITPETFDKTMIRLAKKLGISGKHKEKRVPRIHYKHPLYTDVFSDTPYCITADGNAVPLGMRIAAAVYADEEGEDHLLPVMESDSFSSDIVKRYITPLSCTDSGTADSDSYTLFSMFSDRISAPKLNFIVPDVVDEFRLAPIRRAARMFYSNIDALPQSIGAVFAFEGSELFEDYYSVGDLILVADIVDDDLTLTPIRGVYSNELEGIVDGRPPIQWERYPTASYTNKKPLQDFSSFLELKTLFRNCNNDKNRSVPVLTANGWQKMSDFSTGEDSLIIDYDVRQYISKHKSIVNGSRVLILSIDERLDTVNHEHTIISLPSCCCVQGYHRCNYLTQQAGVPLWKDHLPDLSFRQALTVFDLVKGQTVIPNSDDELVFRISNHFTLPAGRGSYSFELLQEDANSKVNRHAVLRHKAFPLSCDVECRLTMRYKYGADDPYTLIFTPINKAAAGFSEVIAHWEKDRPDYSYCDAVWPEFPEPYPVSMLHRFPKRGSPNQYSDIFDRVIRAFNLEYYEYHFTGRESWKDFIDRNTQKLSDSVMIFVDGISDDGKTTALVLYDNDRKLNLRNSDVAFFSVYYHKKKQQYRAKNVSVDLEDFYRKSVYEGRQYLTGCVFHLHMLLTGGRRLDDLSYPPELATSISKMVGYVWEMYLEIKEDPDIPDNDKRNTFTLLCLLYSFMNEDFYDHLIFVEIDNYLQAMQKGDYYNLYSSIGYAIGPCETEDQKRLFNKILEISKKRPQKAIGILARSIWRHPDMIFNAGASNIMKCFDCSLALIAYYVDKVQDMDNGIEEYAHNMVACFEFALATFRLRKTGDPEICDALRYRSKKNNKLREAIHKLIELKNQTVFNAINKSMIKLQLNNSDDEDIPPLLRALLLYSAGNLEGDEIKITVDEHE